MAGDVAERVAILFVFARLLGLTPDMIKRFSEDPEHNTYTMTVVFYLASQLFQACFCALTAVLLPVVKGVMISLVVAIVVPAALWIASLHVAMPGRVALIFAALFLDLFNQTFIFGIFQYSRSHDTAVPGVVRLLPRHKHRAQSRAHERFRGPGVRIFYHQRPLPELLLIWHQFLPYQVRFGPLPSFCLQLALL